jgi:hypothetical protein
VQLDAFTAWLSLALATVAGCVRSCADPTPQPGARRPEAGAMPMGALPDPSAVSRKADDAWRAVALSLVHDTHADYERLRAELTAETLALPQGSVDVPGERGSEMATQGLYGRLPEVVVDHDEGAIFPVPVSPPARFSWYQVSLKGREEHEAIARFEKGLKTWKRMSMNERVRRFGELEAAWQDVEDREAGLANHVRYLETWLPRLWRQWDEAQATGSKPPHYTLTAAIRLGDPRLMEPLRELLKPTRAIHRPFLPDKLVADGPPVTLPIVTDVTDRRFLAEVEGALATHWNQSYWARTEGVRFHIRWSPLPRDRDFARAKISLDGHLARIAEACGSATAGKSRRAPTAAMTTGGLTTYVHGSILVLGPGRINPRTLAHELGHLMGFPDCYLRTLTSQGALGTAVLEWDNPLYPDDLMCDNAVGTARAEVW